MDQTARVTHLCSLSILSLSLSLSLFPLFSLSLSHSLSHSLSVSLSLSLLCVSFPPMNISVLIAKRGEKRGVRASRISCLAREKEKKSAITKAKGGGGTHSPAICDLAAKHALSEYVGDMRKKCAGEICRIYVLCFHKGL